MSHGILPGHLGIKLIDAEPNSLRAYLQIKKHHLNPSGFIHGGTIVTLADSLAGYATALNLPDNSSGFTTIELKANFLSTARDGKIFGEAIPVHIGRTTQVWDARIWRESDEKTIAEFRCTQLVLAQKTQE